MEDVASPYADKERQKAYNKEYRKKYYQKNKRKIQDRINTYRRNKRKEYREWKATLSCVKCGYSHPAAIDFHHVIKSADNQRVTDLVRNGRFGAAQKEALERCIVLCANCHRILHDEEGRAESQ